MSQDPSDPEHCRLDCLRSDGTPHPECPIHGRHTETTPPPKTLTKLVDFDPPILKCPSCGQKDTRTSYSDRRGTPHLQRCRYCGLVAPWTTFERLDVPTPMTIETEASDE
jgi:predicted RNA-binding Zn-ribbon protein involved in translation (DUF1610 family)